MPMKDGKPIPYQKGGGANANAKVEVVLDEGPSYQDKVNTVMEVFKLGRSTVADFSKEDLNDVYKKALEKVDKPTGRNMGGVVQDELGYMGGGVSYSDRGPIKYSKGGAVSGKNFKGSF